MKSAAYLRKPEKYSIRNKKAKVTLNFKMIYKLLIGFFSITMFLVILGISSISSINTITDKLKNVYTINMDAIETLGKLKTNLVSMDVQVSIILDNFNSGRIGEVKQKIEALRIENRELTKRYKMHGLSLQETESLEKFEVYLEMNESTRDQIIEYVRIGNLLDANSDYRAQTSNNEDMLKVLDELIKMSHTNAQEYYTESLKVAATAERFTYSITFICIAAGITLAAILFRSLARRFNEIIHYTEIMAGGDLTIDIQDSGNDELSKVIAALDKCNINIKKVVRAIKEGALNLQGTSNNVEEAVQKIKHKMNTINLSVKHIYEGVNYLSTISEEVTASTEEITSITEVLSAKAEEGRQASMQIQDMAQKLNMRSKQSAETAYEMFQEKRINIIKAIEEGKVLEEIKLMAETITSVSEQTNLLALNASIEAA